MLESKLRFRFEILECQDSNFYPMIPHKQHPRGSVLVFTLLILAILLSTALSAAGIVVLGKNSSRATEKSALAFQIADGAAENVLKRIYRNSDATLGTLASNLYADGGQGTPTCDNGTVIGSLPQASSGTYAVTFLDNTGTPLQCSGTGYDTYSEWRTKLSKIVSSGAYGSATRAIDIAIEPIPCDVPTVDDADGNTYDTVSIGGKCWMKENIRVGTRLDSTSTPQTNNGTIEKYCYNDDPQECTATQASGYSNGGLYTWDEAMQYVTTEGAQGICPTGWHIPSDTEWYNMEHYLDPTVNNPNQSGIIGTTISNLLRYGGSSGFEANFAGVWHDFPAPGVFMGKSGVSVFWSSTLGSPSTLAWTRYINSGAIYMREASDRDQLAWSVRCTQD